MECLGVMRERREEGERRERGGRGGVTPPVRAQEATGRGANAHSEGLVTKRAAWPPPQG